MLFAASYCLLRVLLQVLSCVGWYHYHQGAFMRSLGQNLRDRAPGHDRRRRQIHRLRRVPSADGSQGSMELFRRFDGARSSSSSQGVLEACTPFFWLLVLCLCVKLCMHMLSLHAIPALCYCFCFVLQQMHLMTLSWSHFSCRQRLDGLTGCRLCLLCHRQHRAFLRLLRLQLMQARFD